MNKIRFVSVVVPVLNGERVIRECLISLLRMDQAVERLEILVVDNGSTDRTADIIKSFPVRYLREDRKGAPCARNTGITASRGQILAFTDADCIVSRGWLRELVRPFDEERTGGVAGEIVAHPPKTPAERYAARIRHLSPEKYLARANLPFAVFANLAFRREVFDQIGKVDEALFQGDSTDFCTRFLRQSGLKLNYAPRAIVFHRHRKTTREFFRQQWQYGRGHALLYIKYRQEIPWGLRQSLRAYRDLAAAASALVKSGLRFSVLREDRKDLFFCYFEFLKKLAERLGFMRESFSRGYPHF